MSKMTGGRKYQTNSHVMRRELEEQRKQRRLSEGAMRYTARRNVIDEFAPDKVRNFAALDMANKHTKFEIERASIMQGQINKRDPFNTIVHTHVNPMLVRSQPGPHEYKPKHRGVAVKDPHLLHSSFASKSPQQLRTVRPHTNDTIIAAPGVTHNGLPLRKPQAARIGDTKRDTSMVQYHVLHERDAEKAKSTAARRARLRKKKVPEPKKQFVDPGLFGPVKDERYPAMAIRAQTTRLGPGFYEPAAHPLNCAVKHPKRKSMAFLKTGRRAGPLEWTLNYVPKKDPFVESKKNIFAKPDYSKTDYVPDALFFDRPSSVDIEREKKAEKLAKKVEEFDPRAPICDDPARMQPILSTLSQIEQDMRDVLVYERGERQRKIQRVRNVIATTRFLSVDSRKKSVEELTKTFKATPGGKQRSPRAGGLRK